MFTRSVRRLQDLRHGGPEWPTEEGHRGTPRPMTAGAVVAPTEFCTRWDEEYR